MTETLNLPLVVDLDGTLTRTDTLMESLVQLGKQDPFNLLKMPIWLVKGRAGFKANVANHTLLSAANLPYCTELLEYLRREKQNGRTLILATAANSKIANAVAAHLDLFDKVLASSESYNLKGRDKLAAIQQIVGTDFVYAGDSKADLPIWQASRAAILVNTSRAVATSVRKSTSIELEIPKEKLGIRAWLRAMRVHQWCKNFLLFVPLLTAFSFHIDKIIHISLAFFAFSFLASSTYMGNDLWDLESDRSHPRKKFRPFAGAQISILKGITAAVVLLILGFALAISVSLKFFGMLLLYFLITTTYTWILKTYVLIDIIVLSLLYTLRIIAGSVALDIPTSSWLLAFSVFIFFSLALVKRCSELATLQQRGLDATHGRDYRTVDLDVLRPMGVGSALSAIVVFELFISAPDTQMRYATPQALWLVSICLMYWLTRLWIKTARGEMHDDPLIFAIRDFGSRITIIVMIIVILSAHFITIG